MRDKQLELFEIKKEILNIPKTSGIKMPKKLITQISKESVKRLLGK